MERVQAPVPHGVLQSPQPDHVLQPLAILRRSKFRPRPPGVSGTIHPVGSEAELVRDFAISPQPTCHRPGKSIRMISEFSRERSNRMRLPSGEISKFLTEKPGLRSVN